MLVKSLIQDKRLSYIAKIASRSFAESIQSFYKFVWKNCAPHSYRNEISHTSHNSAIFAYDVKPYDFRRFAETKAFNELEM